MGLGGLLLLLMPDLLTPRGPSTPAPPLLCSPVGLGSPTSLVLQGTSWMSGIGLPAKARPWGQRACGEGAGERIKETQKPLRGGGSPQPGRRTGACPVLAPLASKTRRVTPPPPSVWFPRGPWGCAASRKAQPWTFQPSIQAGGARVGDTGGETEDETRLMCEAGPRPHRPSPPGCGPSREAKKTVGDQGAP